MLVHFLNFFALVADFAIFWRVLSHLSFFSQLFCDFGSIFGGFGKLLGRILGGFFDVLEQFS